MILMLLLKIFFFGFLGNKQRFSIFCHLFLPTQGFGICLKKNKQVGGSGNICCFFHDSQVLLYFLKNTNFFSRKKNVIV